jgi:hypothetical protein
MFILTVPRSFRLLGEQFDRGLAHGFAKVHVHPGMAIVMAIPTAATGMWWA